MGSKPINPGDSDSISNVGSISANNDPEIGKKLAEAIVKIGKDGIITVEEGKGMETELELVQGMKFDRGYISPYFINDENKMNVQLEDACILIHEKKLSDMNTLLPIVEKTFEAGKSLLVLAEDIEGEARNLLVLNRMHAGMKVAAVKAPGFGDRRKAMLEDIATLTGATAVMEDNGMKLEELKISDLGTAGSITITKDNTTIVGGGGSGREVKARALQIRCAIKESSSDYDREKLQERLAKLVGGIAVLQ